MQGQKYSAEEIIAKMEGSEPPKSEKFKKTMGKIGGVTTAAGTGAAIGAVIGFGVPGAIVGSIVGGIVGLIGAFNA